MGELRYDEGLLEDIAAALDLRRPNRDAAESVLVELSNHVDVKERSDQFTGIVDTATAVGKTYTAAAIIDYLARDRGWRDFLIVTPGRVVRDKTIQNFSTGTKRSLVHDMESPIEVITVDPATGDLLAAQALQDDLVVKVYVFTIQALLAPSNSKKGKKTHHYSEVLGEALYSHLQSLEDLVVIADEHHGYSGPAFAKALADLHARAMVGLTATPKKADEKSIVYRYPLAAAIAENWVKRPTIVGRSDDLDDIGTKLADGLRIVERKREVAAVQAAALGLRINPVMFVVCRDTKEADELAALVRGPDFAEGRYAGDAVLVVHSKVKPEDEPDAYKRLSSVEHPDSPVRIIISVGMLREGWDVKNVYVLLTTRPSVSDVLTEQVLGRGLRLAYGEITGVPLLDTLDVIAHEKYEKLLAGSGVLNETFVSHVTRHRAVRDSNGGLVSQKTEAQVGVTVMDGGPESSGLIPGTPAPTEGGPVVEVTDTATRQMEIEQPEQSQAPKPIGMVEGSPQINVPSLTRVPAVAEFSLTDIADRKQFVDLGQSIAVDPLKYLRRTTIDATVVRNVDGTLSTQLSQSQAVDNIEVAGATIPTAQARKTLVDAIVSSDVVSARAHTAVRERNAAGAIVDAFIKGLNGGAENLLSAYLGRATGRLLKALRDARKAAAAKPAYESRVSFRPLLVARHNHRPLSGDRVTKLTAAQLRGTAFHGWQRSIFELDWFDSDTERKVALLLDDKQNPIAWWVRLLTGDLPIQMYDQGANGYHPDFVAIDTDGIHWIVEAKADRDMASDTVQAKRAAARVWVNNVNAAQPEGNPEWRYLLASESDVADANSSWQALLKLTGSDWG